MISRGTNPTKFRREAQHHERHRKLCYNHSIANIHPFEGNPYHVQDNEGMQFLCKSIRENGVLSPLLVRKIGAAEEYEVISGHRRLYAAHKLGLTELPTVTTDLDRNAAAIALVDSNLHREHILPSEKAFAYKLKTEALSHQGAACGQAGHKSRDAVSDTDSGRQVQRYIRLTCLIPELLNKLDTGEMALSILMRFIENNLYTMKMASGAILKPFLLSWFPFLAFSSVLLYTKINKGDISWIG